MSRSAPVSSSPAGDFHDDIIYPDAIPFVIVHLACLGAIWSGVTVQALIICFVLYVVRMFGVTAGYHRYFSHRTFKTSRVMQFLFAWLAQSSGQKGALWWAELHRHHHRHSDTEQDVHSPRMSGFFYSHVGWIFDPRYGEVNLEAVPDLAKYPELVWLQRQKHLPAIVLAVACFAVAGWSGLFVGFFWSTVLLYHGTFFINSLAHVHGKQRYVTGDDSRNNWWLAIITLGEGWHNNHHAYQRSTRQGFRWYEFDPTFYVLKVMSWMRLVWDLGEPPAEVVRNERMLGRAVVEKVARQLAASFPVERLAASARESWAEMPWWAELCERVNAGQLQLEDLMQTELTLPDFPSMAELRERASEMMPDTPSMDQIVERARELLLQSVSRELMGPTPSPGAA
jgi:stearoyl-CoA desaturase (Delta-9 desaturase)